MGLDTDYECWSGGYGAFNRWRGAIAQCGGLGDLNMYPGHGHPDGRDYPASTGALLTLFDHSDCDGEIKAEECEPLANALESLLPSLDRAQEVEVAQHPGLKACLDRAVASRTRTFISGLREAVADGESVGFH